MPIVFGATTPLELIFTAPIIAAITTVAAGAVNFTTEGGEMIRYAIRDAELQRRAKAKGLLVATDKFGHWYLQLLEHPDGGRAGAPQGMNPYFVMVSLLREEVAQYVLEYDGEHRVLGPAEVYSALFGGELPRLHEVDELGPGGIRDLFADADAITLPAPCPKCSTSTGYQNPDPCCTRGHLQPTRRSNKQ